MSKVIVTGILGQDGANMAEYLLDATDHEVVGVMRRSANPNYKNIESIRSHPRFTLDFLELNDTVSIDNLVQREKPDYFINFVAWRLLKSFNPNVVFIQQDLQKSSEMWITRHRT